MASIAATWSTVSSIGWPIRAPIASASAVLTARSAAWIDRHLGCRIADPLAAAGHHPELQRQELVERETAERGVTVREGRRVVGRLDRLRDRHQPFLGDDLGRHVLGIREARLVERLADRRPEADRREPRRQAVDRHDPSGVEQLGVVGDDLELGVVEGQAAPEMLDLARHDDLGADEQPALDEAPPEPGRIDAPGLVLESRDGPLGPAAEARFDPHVPDRRLGRDHRPVRGPGEVADLAHLAQVVVAPRQVEEQVADGVEVELDPGPAQRGAGRQAGLRQWGRQQLDRVGRCLCRDRRLGHAYSAEMRYR